MANQPEHCHASRRGHILIVAYYFPPSGGSGVQRPLKWAKYLDRQGWQVSVLSAAPERQSPRDPTLLVECPDTVEIVRPGRHGAHRSGGTTEPVSGPTTFPPWAIIPENKRTHADAIARRTATWLRWPDTKLTFAHRAIRTATQYWEQEGTVRPDIVITTSPPPSIHAVGSELQDRWECRWIADFRDPWFPKRDEWGPSRLHRLFARRLRKSILHQADIVTAASDAIAADLKGDLPEKRSGKIKIIPNGYDEDDFEASSLPPVSKQGCFSFVLIGTIVPDTDPAPLLSALRSWSDDTGNLNWRLLHIGADRANRFGDLIGQYNLAENSESLGYKSHGETVSHMLKADCLLLSLADRPGLDITIPGRVYEMLRSNRPLIVTCPRDGALWNFLNNRGGVFVHSPYERTRLIESIRAIQQGFGAEQEPDDARLEEFSRENQTTYLSAICESLLGSP